MSAIEAMVRYTVKPEWAAENERLIRAVYDELARTAPATLRYATFRLEDGVSFVHLAAIDTEDGSSPLQDVQAFREFKTGLGERCAEAPVRVELHAIGSYRRRA